MIFFIKNIWLICLCFVFSNLSYGKNPDSDNDKVLSISLYKKNKLASLPYFVDDIQIIGGLNYGGLYMSRQYQNLNYTGGFNVGVESLLPIGQIIFLNYGVHFAQRNFQYRNSQFTNNFIDLPLYASYELPILKEIDLRFFLGSQFNYRLSSTNGEFTAENPPQTDYFQFNTNDFKRFDFGWTFGLSGEYRSVFFRLRSFVGTRKLDIKDQGTMNTFNMELGYFLFRNFRK
jgi:hypothetical protein